MEIPVNQNNGKCSGTIISQEPINTQHSAITKEYSNNNNKDFVITRSMRFTFIGIFYGPGALF